jgi:hypothetical protein
MGMDPGFHRGDAKDWIPACAGMTQNKVDLESKLLDAFEFEPMTAQNSDC